MGLSIQKKVFLSLSLLGALILCVSFIFMKNEESALIENIIKEQAKHTADSYFDSVNILMLTGQMANREILRKKILSRPGVIEATIVRGEKVVQLYGDGFDQLPKDQLDRDALNGQYFSGINQRNDKRVLTVLEPIVASENYRGTNCLGCHQAKEGDVLGAVRISYDLTDLDEEVEKSLLTNLAIQIVVFCIGFVVLGLFFRRVLLNRLIILRDKILHIDTHTDLTQTFEDEYHDELGEVSDALNSMICKFKGSLSEVVKTVEQLHHASSRLSETAQLTSAAAEEQKMGADSVAVAMNEMEATAKEVRRNASITSDKSCEANDHTQNGIDSVLGTVDSILSLKTDIERSAEVITSLDQKTHEVSNVLNVISAIAEQTNLLALNAAIEAARAGESGRGFAVVADEVRTLAIKTHDSTQEIRNTIEQLQNEAKRAVEAMDFACKSAEERSEQVNDVAQSLRDIAGFMQEMNSMNAQISQSVDEQSFAVVEINTNMVSIRDHSETTANEAGTSLTVASELVELSKHLDQQVQMFKL